MVGLTREHLKMRPLKLVGGTEDVVNHRTRLTSETNKKRDSKLLEQVFTLLEQEKKVKREKSVADSH